MESLARLISLDYQQFVSLDDEDKVTLLMRCLAEMRAQRQDRMAVTGGHRAVIVDSVAAHVRGRRWEEAFRQIRVVFGPARMVP
ncbi:MAG TPA: hypothetical protein VFM48_02720 [Aquabacterium sp.]|nr:hypothetical protein [Aquabacterium sp.]